MTTQAAAVVNGTAKVTTTTTKGVNPIEMKNNDLSNSDATENEILPDQNTKSNAVLSIFVRVGETESLFLFILCVIKHI